MNLKPTEGVYVAIQNRWNYGKPLNSSQNRALIREYKSESGVRKQDLLDQIVRGNMGLVGMVARQVERTVYGRLELQDLEQEGTFGLMRAIELYDCSRTETFSTYANHWIYQFISRKAATTGPVMHIPDHASKSGAKPEYREAARRALSTVTLDPSLDRESREAGPDELYESVELNEMVREAVSRLSPQRQEAVQRRFGFGCQPETYRQMGNGLGVCKQTASEITAKAIQELRESLSGLAVC